MRKTYQGFITLGVLLLVSAAATAGTVVRRGAVQPTGQTVFSIDTPRAGDTVFGIVEVRGFVLDPRGVSRITLLVDGSPVHDADINQARTDVRRKYPAFEGEGFPYDPGFTTSFLAGNYTSGPHQVAIQVTYADPTRTPDQTPTAVLGERTVVVDASANQPPLGGLDSPRNPDIYGQQDVLSGVYPLTGWAIDDKGIRQRTSPAGCVFNWTLDCLILADIDVMVDNRVVAQAIYPLPRPDVANAHPDVTNALNSGWQMNLDTTRFTNGQHSITVRAWDTDGASRIIGAQMIWIDNNYTTLKPIGRIDWPMSNGHFYPTSCIGPGPSGEYQSGSSFFWVSGWALDQNDILRYTGVRDVQLLIDGMVYKSTATDCIPNKLWGMEVNCYGIYQRPDILYKYPQFPVDAKYSGYFFVVDVDYLMSVLKVQSGLHLLSVEARTLDPNRPAVVIDQIPVIFECNPAGDYASLGDLERPVNMADLKGSQLLRGWVIDANYVIRLNFYVDGVLDGSLLNLDPHLHMARPDLSVKYPWLPLSALAYSGFEYTLDTTKYVDGVHQIVIESVDQAGFRTYWVQRPLRFDNLNRP